MKRILLNFLFVVLFLTLLISCKKEKEETVLEIGNDSINNVYIKSNPKNIYHSKYTNVVKIQGKYLERDDYSKYFSLGEREEGIYSNYDIFDAIRFGSLQRVIEIVEYNSALLFELQDEKIYEYNQFMDEDYKVSEATTLMFAIFHRDMGIIKYLLDSIEKIHDDKTQEWYLEATDSDGWNAFMWACGVGTADIIKMLVEKYPDYIYSQNSYGANGLHMAALNGNIPVFDYLVKDLGMDITSTDDDWENVYDYAKNEETDEALKKLEDWVMNRDNH